MSWFTESGSTFDMGPRFLLLDTNRQSSIPGLYMAGDVTGKPEIKAAINTGAVVARHLLEQDIDCRPPCDAHAIIIGGGPAGDLEVAGKTYLRRLKWYPRWRWSYEGV
jgi:thioredoxin reductase